MDVFISYSSIEYDTAKHVRDVLEKNNITTWMAPESIPGGDSYTRAIPTAIDECKVCLVLASRNSQMSEWVLSEIETALNYGKIIVPFILERFDLNKEFNFLLSRRHRIQAFEEKSKAFEELVDTIYTHLGIKQGEDTVSSVEEVLMDNQSLANDISLKYDYITYENGDVYFGEIKNGNPHGRGELTFANGEKYFGEYVDGKRTGNGKFISLTGLQYVGQFNNGRYNGTGTLTFANGSYYIGDFVDNEIHGIGEFCFSSGDVYQGDFANGEFHGIGTLTFANGETYTGYFNNGVYHGTGEYVDVSQSEYFGNFVDGDLSLKVKFICKNGSLICKFF